MTGTASDHGPTSPSRDATSARAGASRKRLLFFTSNGVGLGHVTRLMACARRLPDDVEPVFVTLSLAIDAVRSEGYLCEHVPRHPEWKAPVWNPFLHHRLGRIFETYRPSALVFDGTFPYGGLIKALREHRIPAAWMRRAMWKSGVGADALARTPAFDVVIEPGELAESEDRGLTVGERRDVVRVDPITFFDRDECLSPAEARADLGLDPGRTTALLMLGSYRTGETDASGTVALQHLLRVPHLDVVLVGAVPPETVASSHGRVKHLVRYPLGRHLRAFDFAVSAAGYNAFHELMSTEVPTVLVPQLTKTDDQAARARYSMQEGIGLHVSSSEPDELRQGLDVMIDPGSRAAMREGLERHRRPNGADAAARALGRLVGSRRTDRPAARDLRVPGRTR